MDDPNKIELLKKILDESFCTVILCGSGIMEEHGYKGIKNLEKAYEIEEKYGESPEELFSSVYYNTRPLEFFDFYRNEILQGDREPSDTFKVAARMEEQGKLHCIITANMYEYPQRAGCKNVINLHGSVYNNCCSHCGKKFPLEYVKMSKKIPVCDECGHVIRPQVSLFGEMMDSQIMTKATWEIENADVLLLVGTSLESEVFSKYINYFEGRKLVVIHRNVHHTDDQADLVIWDEPKTVFTKLGY